MEYRTAWADLKRWLDNSMDYLDEQMEEERRKNGYLSKEYKRLESKREGLYVTRDYIRNSEINYIREEREKKDNEAKIR